MWILCILLFIHYILTYRSDTNYITSIQSDNPPLMVHGTGNAILITKHAMDEMLMLHHIGDAFMAHMFAYSLATIANIDQIGSLQLLSTEPIVDNSAYQQMHVLYLPVGDAFDHSCNHIKDKAPKSLKQNMSSKSHLSSATSFLETTTTITVMAHPFDQCFSAHLIEETVVARPDETAVRPQIEDNTTVNRIKHDDADIDEYIHSKHDGVISHFYINSGINMIGANINTEITMSSTLGTCTHSRPLRCLCMTVSRELLLVVCKCWSYPSCKGRVDTVCARFFGNTTTYVVDSFFFLLLLTQQMIIVFKHVHLILFTYHDVPATYTCISISITSGGLVFIQRWNAPLFLQSHDRVIQLESDQGIGLRANNRSDLAADISRSFSNLKHRSIFWIILLCVCVSALMSLFYFSRVAMHDSAFSS